MGLPGKVVEIRDGWVFVEVTPRSDCQGCSACQGLMTEGSAKTRIIQAISPTVNPAVGDEVLLEAKPGEGSLAAFLVFGLPLIGFLLGVFVGGPLLTRMGGASGEGGALLCGLIGLFLPWVMVYALGHFGYFRGLSLKVVAITRSTPTAVAPEA